MESQHTAQTGQFHMSPHPSQTCHQPAPIASMVVQSAIPAKRGPEEDVQFVSVQPVKKARGSRDSPPAQYQQTHDQSITHQQAQNQGPQAHDTNLSNIDAASEPHHKSSISNRGVSFPGLTNFVFPPPPNSKPSRTSRSSPLLSPRQLPQPVLSVQTQNTFQTPQGLRGFVQAPQFQVPWGMSGLYPQAAPMKSDVPLSRPTPLPSVQQQHVEAHSPTDIDDQPLSMSMAFRKMDPETLRQSGQVPSAGVGSPSTRDEHEQTAQASSNQAAYGQAKTLPYQSPRQEPQSRAQTSSHTQIHPPTPTVIQPRPQSPANIASNNLNTVTETEGTTSQQNLPLKGPCVICEQMRQQILSNHANGLPIAHLPQMSHGWHGLSPMAQGQLAHPNAGVNMTPSMLQTLQQRLQPFPLAHVPMGYGMQSVPVQVQMQMQRQSTTPPVNGAESSQGVTPQSQHGQHTQAQQALAQPPQYMYSQLPTLLQSVMMQRPMMMHQQALAPPPPPPSPRSSPKTTQTTTEVPAQPEPKKHSPNLIVDIAETCEELFPYAEVAKRHGVTRVKVVETFGAVIQLPLLRCTTDKKRHGKLATNRLREYTKAKKDAEASNAASSTKSTPAAPTAPTLAGPVAQIQTAPQVEAHQTSAAQTQTQTKTQQVQAMQTQAIHNQATRAQAMQAQAMQVQVNQMYADQGNISQNQPLPPSSQVQASQDRSTLPGVFEMANTISPLGLPSNLTLGLSGHWQQQ